MKPREFWIEEYMNGRYSAGSKEDWPESAHDKIFCVIEKSAADKLADALDQILGTNEFVLIDDIATKALADYRPQK